MTKNIHLVSIAAPFRYGFQDMTRPPSGALYVGAILKHNGFDVLIHHITEDDSEATVSEIIKECPIFVGFSVMTGVQISASAKMSSILKSVKPDIPIVWGGIHPSLMPKETLLMGMVDFAVVGEGENTALELAQHLEKNPKEYEQIEGTAFLKNGEIIIAPPRAFEKNLDNFRQDWSLVDIQRYVRKSKGQKAFCFITSRGCPHSCGFCYNQAFNKRKWRAHSPDHVVGELRKIKEKTGISLVNFDDDNFFTNRKRGLEILKRLVEIGITCYWVELRIDYVTEEFISQLVKLGVRSIFFGWESGCDKTLGKIAKGFTSSLILEKTRILAKFPQLTVDASAIVGFPWEDETAMRRTVSLALKMFRIKPFKLNFNIGLYVPYPGSPIIPDATGKGFRFPADSEEWRKFDILSGAMELPWLKRSIVRKYTLIDRYAKLLYVVSKRKWWTAIIAYILAAFAYMRLKTGILKAPVEIRLVDWYYRKRLEA